MMAQAHLVCRLFPLTARDIRSTLCFASHLLTAARAGRLTLSRWFCNGTSAVLLVSFDAASTTDGAQPVGFFCRFCGSLKPLPSGNAWQCVYASKAQWRNGSRYVRMNLAL
jgi:hypothetical protein